ncbi:LysR substrate-binding domain-containing protein [Zobellella iuensis]|jgi:DNA-binding transcriptional LysR family regulator|uniref:LysR family transcriptional regulator n=1 Tax=Zobellella iuensis TaxID=2803811 RepID=A0ABS1QPS5_9GAMM|nr:LysR substrate-binding domain-containing protein [Zobellella iuensis]MBL1376486.1 LysR family transcriptional regulator [Zobellella iuensis]
MTEPIRPLPPLNCLQAFEAAARGKSFTQAAYELSLTQSAISRQIKRLEEYLGRPLFHRDAMGVELTPTGKHYFHLIQRLLRELADGTAELTRYQGALQLTLASSPTVASMWLTRKLPTLQARYPRLDIRILTMEDPRRLELSEFDLALYYRVPGEIEPPGVDCTPIFGQEKVICVCSPNYLLQSGPITSPENLLQQHVMLVVEDFYHDWLTWQDWFLATGHPYTSPKRTLRANSYQLLMQAALAGQGVAMGWSELFAPYLEEQSLIQALPEYMPSKGLLSLMEPRHRHPTEAIRQFKKWLFNQ